MKCASQVGFAQPSGHRRNSTTIKRTRRFSHWVARNPSTHCPAPRRDLTPTTTPPRADKQIRSISPIPRRPSARYTTTPTQATLPTNTGWRSIPRAIFWARSCGTPEPPARPWQIPLRAIAVPTSSMQVRPCRMPPPTTGASGFGTIAAQRA